VPAIAFTAATRSEATSVSSRAETACLLEIACQKPSAPSPVDFQTMAPIGRRTMTLR
jgi:hypothetical protein